MTPPHLQHAASNYVFRLLGRQRAHAQRAPGSALAATLVALRDEGRSALIEVELASGSLGRLLLQVGRVVFAQHESSDPEKALAEIQRGAADARLYILELSSEQIIFACAALAGIPLALGETLGTDHVPALLAQLAQQNFTGVVALEQGLQTLIWRFQRGRALNTVKLPERIRAGRLTQFVWQEQMLREVGDAAPDSDTQNSDTRNGVPPPTHSTPPDNTSAHNVAAQNAKEKSTAARAAPVQTAPPQDASTRYTPARDVPVQTDTAQPSPAQPNSIQPVPVQTTYVPNTSATQIRYGTNQDPRRARRQEAPQDTEEVWARFREVLSAQLGNRAERVFGLMYGELGGFSRAELIGRLTAQVERIAGSAAARAFKNGF